MDQLARWGLIALGSLVGVAAQGQAVDLKTGLKAYWPFEGNFEDAVNDFDGTENGSSAIVFENSKGGFGKAIKLDGTDQFVEITGGEPDDLAFEGGSVSISTWFKVDAFDTDWQALVAKGEGSNWRVARNGSNPSMSYAGGLTDAAGTIDVTDGNWHHIVAISDAAGANFGTTIYVDGQRDGTIEGAAALAANGARVMIGENPGARGREWEGSIDDVAIWDRVLTEAEVAALWAGGVGKPLSAFFAPPNDSDNDGMPNDWELEYGFNPNDPNDAALDPDGDGASNLDEYKAGTNPTDTTKPTILSAVTSSTFDSITITYSEDLDPATATNLVNYTITPSLSVTAATYRNRIVTLTTASQTPGGTAYTVAIKGVRDTSKNEVAAGTQTTVFSYILTKTGVLRIAVWENIQSTPVQNLYDDPRYPATPDRVGAVFSFNSRDYLPSDSLENYGATMEGFLTPSESGSYRFFIYSDDASELYLSTDDKEANLVLIAEETGCCNNFTEPDSPRTSEPVSLVAGRKYFVRMVYKEGGGGDYGQVAWRKEGDTTPAGSLRPISGLFLSSAVDLPAPADGSFLTQSPGANAKTVAPDTLITVVHTDGKSEWTAANVSMKYNGVAVTPTFTKTGNQARIVYDPPGLLASKSTQTVALTYPDPSGQPTTREWSFEVAEYTGPTKDKIKGYEGLIFGTASFTADKGGRSGAAGDYAMDFVNGGGTVNVLDASWLNSASAGDKVTVAFWQKNTVRASSSFWFNSPSSNNGTRGLQAHVPWSDSTIYFDSAGCCDVDIQRISLNIDQFSGYTGDATFFQTWRHYAFVKNGATKEIYIDGTLFHSGGGSPLPTDFTSLVLGGGPSITENRMAGTMDDFAVYSSALSAAQIDSLAKGTAPGAVTGSPGLIAHWDFNDAASAVSPTIGIARAGAAATITYTGTLQSADSPAGPYTDVAGATSPHAVNTGAAQKYYRTRN